MAIWVPPQISEPTRSLHVICVETSYTRADGSIFRALDYLKKERHAAGVPYVVTHFLPAFKNGVSLKRPHQGQFNHVSGLGGTTEEQFGLEGLCLIVDDVVNRGWTLSLTAEYLKLQGYSADQLWVAAAEMDSVHNVPLSGYNIFPVSYYEGKLVLASQDMEFNMIRSMLQETTAVGSHDRS